MESTVMYNTKKTRNRRSWRGSTEIRKAQLKNVQGLPTGTLTDRLPGRPRDLRRCCLRSRCRRRTRNSRRRTDRRLQDTGSCEDDTAVVHSLQSTVSRVLLVTR